MPIRMTALSAVSAAPAAASLSIRNRVTAASSGASPTPDASSAPQLRCGSRWRSAVTASSVRALQSAARTHASTW